MILWQKLIQLELINSCYKFNCVEVKNPSQTYKVYIITAHSDGQSAYRKWPARK